MTQARSASVFDQLHPDLRSALARLGYSSPTPVQERAIPLVLKGYNVLIVAPTGWGKTEAAMLPLIDMIIRHERSNRGVKLVYVTPLRALNRDILERIEKLASFVGLSVAVRHSDTPQSLRRKMVTEAPDILITTPETLQIMLVGPKLRHILKHVKYVVVDEVHELLDSKRGVQLALGLERLEKLAGRRLQRVGLSATIEKPILAAEFLACGRHVEIVEVRVPRPYAITIRYLDSPEKRLEALTKLIEKHKGSILLFTNTRDTAELLGSRLSEALGALVRVHHGSLEKSERLESESAFKKGAVRTLVCTSSLELGVDIGKVDLVVQYMSPRQAIRLAQRVGRSGHSPGREAKGIIVCSDIQDLLESAVISTRVLRGDLERTKVYEKALDVLAHQLVGMALEAKDGISLKDAWNIITRSYPFRGLTLGDLFRLARFLDQIGLLRVTSDEVLRPRKGSIKYYFENVSMIPQTSRLKVFDLSKRKVVGSLDETFVAANLESGDYFVLGGRPWRVESIDYEESVINVKPATGEAVVPAWVGEDIPVSYWVAREIGALKRRLACALTSNDPDTFRKIAEEYGLSAYLEEIKDFIKSQIEACRIVPSDKTVLIEVLGRITVIHAHIGTNANYALGLLLSHAISRSLGITVRFRATPYGVILIAPLKLRSNLLLSYLNTKLLDLVEEAVERSGLFRQRILHVARRFGILSPEVKRVPRPLLEMLKNTPVGEEALREVLFYRLDLEGLKRLLQDLETGRVHVRLIKRAVPSPFAEALMLTATKGGYVIPPIPTAALIRIVRERLFSTKVRLLCLHCLAWSREVKVGEYEGKPLCPICGSRLIAVLSPWDEDTYLVLRKKKEGRKLSDGETRLLQRAVLSAKLFSHYGKRALLVLAGRGVGPQTAARILSRCLSEEDLIKEVIKAEEAYARTRRFWTDTPTKSKVPARQSDK